MAVFTRDFSTTAMAINNDEREFFVTLGERITALRKARTTQVQLARTLGVSQQTIQAYGSGQAASR